jgi:hypothetical protein
VTAATLVRRPAAGAFGRGIRDLGVAAVTTAAAVAIAYKLPTASPVTAAMVVGVFILGGVMFVSQRVEVTLAILMVYLGVLDGYLKLKTNSQASTLGRDLLLYAIAAGVLVRAVVAKQRLQLPPLSGWVIAWTAVILVQLFNPSNGTWSHSIAALRPHLEFIPLFFLGYTVMRTKARLRGFLVLLLVITAVNAVAGFIQFNQTPEQLAAWGPGYASRINGTGDVAGRAFRDSSGEVRPRPFALGSDAGYGGIVGMMAAPALLALLALARRNRLRLLAVALSAGVVVAVLTSQARTAILGTVFALAAFAIVAAAGRGGGRALGGLAIAGIVGYFVITTLTGSTSSSAFSRYQSIAPSKAATTAVDYRKGTLGEVPRYMKDIPLGAGIGSKGPAAKAVGERGAGAAFNGESEPTFLLIEAGIPGLVVMLGFMLYLMFLSLTRIRPIPDQELRLLLAGVAAPLFAIAVTGFVGINTATTPSSPYLWFIAGALAFWLLPRRDAHRGDIARARRVSTH